MKRKWTPGEVNRLKVMLLMMGAWIQSGLEAVRFAIPIPVPRKPTDLQVLLKSNQLSPGI